MKWLGGVFVFAITLWKKTKISLEEDLYIHHITDPRSSSISDFSQTP